jgi:2,3-dihydroxybenzoate decarboxylase/5-carboxyvanillate decarboxylase
MSTIDRRAALARMSQLVAAAALSVPGTVAAGAGEQQPPDTASKGHLRKIATEEAFCVPEVAAAIRKVVRNGGTNL